MEKNKDNQKLYMKWWFWVIAGILFIFTISAIFIPDSSCEETEKELKECEEVLSDLLDALDGYDEALEDYCEIDNTNPLCDALLPDN